MFFFGINPLLEALRSGHQMRRIYIESRKKNPNIDRITHFAEKNGVPVEHEIDLDRRCGSRNHQGVCAEIDENSIVRPLPNQMTFSRLVMLDGLQDPQNFGAALRVCEVFGFKDVVFHRGNSCGLNGTAIKASSGANFHLNLYHSNLNLAVKRLKIQEFGIVVLDGKGDRTIVAYEPPEMYCLIVGAEGKGVRHAIVRQADALLRIPLRGAIASLNVSCALGVALHEFSRSAIVD